MKIIEVENLSKKYTIRHQTQGHYLTLRDTLADRFSSLSRRLLKSTSNSTTPQLNIP